MAQTTRVQYAAKHPEQFRTLNQGIYDLAVREIHGEFVRNSLTGFLHAMPQDAFKLNGKELSVDFGKLANAAANEWSKLPPPRNAQRTGADFHRIAGGAGTPA